MQYHSKSTLCDVYQYGDRPFTDNLISFTRPTLL